MLRADEFQIPNHPQALTLPASLAQIPISNATFTMKTMTRRRVSTSFLTIKIFMTICFIYLLLSFFFFDNSLAFNLKLSLLLVSTIFFVGLLYLIDKRKVIEFDGENLYVFDKMRNQESKIPLERIDKILFSVLGLNLFSLSNYSYKIIYHDNNSQIKKVRLFPRTGSDDISKIIQQTKIKNPSVEVCNWSFGLNELFD